MITSSGHSDLYRQTSEAHLLVMWKVVGVYKRIQPGAQRCINLCGRKVNPLLDVCLHIRIKAMRTCRLQMKLLLTRKQGKRTASIAVFPNNPFSASRAKYRAMALLSQTPPCGVSSVGTCDGNQTATLKQTAEFARAPRCVLRPCQAPFRKGSA